MTNLKLKMNYNFIESKLGNGFCKKDVQEARKLIETSTPFTVVGMPGLGISIFLRYLVNRNFAHYIHVDLYELAELKRIEFWKLLLRELGGGVDPKADEGELLKASKKRLFDLVTKYERVVIVFNRFDQLKDEFTTSFFSNLRVLREVNKAKIGMIFSSNRPLYDWAPLAFKRGNIELFSKNFYLKPYSGIDLLRLFKLTTPNINITKDYLERCLRYSGGHFQLFQLLLKSGRLINYLEDQYVRLQLKQIYEVLNFTQRRQIQKVASGDSISDVDPFLLNLGIVKMLKEELTLFTPLMTDFIKNMTPGELSYREDILFSLLKRNLDKIVSKDEIFEAIWKEEQEDASDWALNALVYRLRKRLATQGEYSIENYKKVGYKLVKMLG